LVLPDPGHWAGHVRILFPESARVNQVPRQQIAVRWKLNLNWGLN
jgi:hypothetical protein